MRAVCKREVKALMFGGVGPVIIGAVCAVLFLYYIFNNLIGLQGDIGAVMNATSVMALTFAVPILAMRTFAGETRDKTDQLLFTAPVRISAIVRGKFLALSLITGIIAVIACVLIVILLPFGNIATLSSLTAVLGYWLYACMLSAICMFLSTLTDNPVTAALFSFILILLGVLSGSAFDSIRVYPVRAALSAAFDFTSRLNNIMYGTFDLTSVVYFVSVCAFFLFLCVQSVQRRRFATTKGDRTNTVYSLSMCLAALAALILVNVAMGALPDRSKIIDVTKDRFYSIGTESERIARAVEDPVTLYYIAAETGTESKDENIERLLQAYAGANDNITLSYMDPVINPRFYTAYTETEPEENSVIVVNEDTGRFRVIDASAMQITSLDMSSFASYVTGYDTEGQVTAALQYVTADSDDTATACLLQGHGEETFETSFDALFVKAGWELVIWIPEEAKTFPKNCELLIINAPLRDIGKDTAASVISYLAQGGNLLVITRFDTEEAQPNLQSVLRYYNIEEKKGIIVETAQNMFYFGGGNAMPYYLFPKTAADPVMTNVTAGNVFVPLAEGFDTSGEEEAGVTALLTTSELSYIHTDYETEQNLTQRESDETGPFTVGLRAEKGDSVMYLYASAMLFTADADELSGGANARLFGNTLSLLHDGYEALAAIPVKQLNERIHLTASQSIPIAIVLIATVPLIWIAGLIIWFRRKKQ